MRESEKPRYGNSGLDPQFDDRLVGLIRSRETAYPAAAAYLSSSEYQRANAALRDSLARVEDAVGRGEAYWGRFDQVISDIARALGIEPHAIAGALAEFPSVPRRDFESIRKRLYDTPQYPVSEHLYYIDFPPALERAAYVSEQLGELEFAKARFCDLGCGPGVLFALTLQNQPEWTGFAVDISPHCARYARRLSALKGVSDRAEFHVADARRLPYPEECFDVLLGTEIFEHVPDPDAAIREAARILRRGGHGLLSAPVRLDVGMHLHVFRSSDDVKALYKGAGLELLDFRRKEFQTAGGPFVDTFALARKPG
jgi:SAM-dependent methyltransferase